MSGIRLGIVIPLANEARTVDELLERIARVIDGDDAVFCVLDRVSVDDTRKRVEAFAVRDPRVHCVWAPENRSVVDAYFRGYREALDAGSRWILEMDGGLSHEPEAIPRFVAAMEEGYDYVGGCRFMPGGSHRGSTLRYLVSRGGSVLTNALLGTRYRDMTGGFQCFGRAAMERVVTAGVKSRAHFFQSEIKYMLRDCRIKEIPVAYSSPSPALGSGTVVEALRVLATLVVARWRPRAHG